MQRIIQLSLFISVIFMVFLALNYFIFFTMGNLLSLSNNVIYYLIFLFALSYPAAAVLERTVSHVLTRAFYTFSSAWMGISIFIAIILIGYEILNLIFYVPP
ncbi:MAG: metallophosphoesterase, partial [Methanobacterium sp.]